jgi:serine/threonine protein kinase
LNGRYSQDYFNRKGEFKPIRDLKYWGLGIVLEEKYHLKPEDAKALTAFLLPMLSLDPRNRITAAEALKSEWLCADDGELTADEADLMREIAALFQAQLGEKVVPSSPSV